LPQNCRPPALGYVFSSISIVIQMRDLTLSKRQASSTAVRHMTWVALVLTAVALAGCDGLATTNQAAPESGPDPSYPDVVANYLKSTFKDYTSYEAFEISGPRWVHSFQGWNWLICVRFQDHARKRSYAVFLSGGSIIDGRYATQTDECGTQTYAVFGQMRGAGLGPLY
jgi:hypothetical protein